MASSARETKNERLALRVSPRERELISEAARADHKAITAFVLEAALVKAERVLADRRVFRLDDEQWNSFVRALDRPTPEISEKPRLKRLIQQPSALDP